jgi:hypothetical protein
MLSAPRRPEILPLPICNKVWACLATRFDVRKNVAQSVVKLDQPIIQYGKVTRNEGDLMVARDLIIETEDSRDASFVRVSLVLLLDAQFLNIPFSSILNLWTDMLTNGEEPPNLYRNYFLAN